MKDGPWWNLDAGRINDLQQQDIVELVRRCKQAHFVNVRVRINGAWEEYEADWIKHMEPRPRPLLAVWREAAKRFRRRWSYLWRRKQPRQEEQAMAAPKMQVILNVGGSVAPTEGGPTYTASVMPQVKP